MEFQKSDTHIDYLLESRSYELGVWDDDELGKSNDKDFVAVRDIETNCITEDSFEHVTAELLIE